MAENTDSEILCPLKMEECPIGEELQRLREECVRLRELARIDTLTGFFNYRYLVSVLESEMERTRRTGLPLSLLMVDLDGFKKINDTYGHEQGNKALQWCTSVWREKIRRIDIPCRYGGEEFAIILPGTRLPQAIQAAERLRVALENAPVNINDSRVRLTASFGVEVFSGREDLLVEDFIRQSDNYLFMSKERGKNTVSYNESKFSPDRTEITEDEREALLGKDRFEE